MNAAIEWANGLAAHWARGMWPVLWQTAALAGIVGLILLCARRISPAVRFWLWMLVPLRLLVMPLIVITLPVLAQPAVPQPPAVVAPPNVVSRMDVSPTPPKWTAEPTASRAVVPPRSSVNLSLRSWLMIAWAIGCCLFSFRLARGLLKMRRIARQARENSDARVRDCAREAAAMLGLRKIPRIITAAEGVSPFVLGFLRPVVVLPAELADHVSADELRAVLAHEFAHVRRRDALAGWALACSDVIYFFNPVVHLVKRAIIFERERACDEQVLALAQAPRAVYARALLSATGFTRPAAARLSCAPVLLESGQHLERRLKSIADERRPRAALSRKARVCLLLVAVLALPGITCTERSVIEDRIDYPFVDDPSLPGAWLAVDLVKSIDQFQPDMKQWAGSLFLKGMVFTKEGGTTGWTDLDFNAGDKPTGPWNWTKGLIIHPGDRTAAHCEIKTLAGKDYLFFEWKSGDYSIRKRKPWYYVLTRCAPGDRVVDRTDYPFVDDPALRGTWEAVDYVATIASFDPDRRQWHGENGLYPAELTFDEGGKTSGVWTWTKGMIIHPGNQTAAQYVIKSLAKKTFLFVEWKNDDYAYRKMKPKYFVFMPGGTDDRLVDRTDYPFVDDPAVHGKWVSVDFVRTMDQFHPGRRYWSSRLFLTELTFLDGGKMPQSWMTWTQGLVIHHGDKTASAYTIKTLGGKEYLFFEWKSGDYTIRKMKPCYYVLTRAVGDQTKEQKIAAAFIPNVTPIGVKNINEKVEALKTCLDLGFAPFLADSDKAQMVEALKQFYDLYRLGPHENVKLITAPFPEEREVYVSFMKLRTQEMYEMRAKGAAKEFQARLKDEEESIIKNYANLACLTFHFHGETLSPYGEGYGRFTLQNGVSGLTGFRDHDIKGDPVILQASWKGDSILRIGASRESRVAETEKILQTVLNLPVRLRVIEEERPTVIVRGKYRYRPHPGERLNKNLDEVLIYGSKRREDMHVGGGGTGDFGGFVGRVGDYLFMPIISEVEKDGLPESISYLDGPQERDDKGNLILPPRKAEIEIVFNHLAEQTGLTFSVESRKTELLSVERIEPN
jgi:bla regulator protein BlaR1